MIILKFGGTSVNTKERIDTICSIVSREKDRRPVVVVSALRGVTDLLLSCVDASRAQQQKALKSVYELHNELLNEFTGDNVLQKSYEYLTHCLLELEGLLHTSDTRSDVSDSIIAYGERLSSFIISEALMKSGINAQQVIADRVIITNSRSGEAEFLPNQTREKTENILLPLLSKGIVPVVTGFLGATEEGVLTTLGRGGSDYSAAIIGYSLGAMEIQIWTDVDGIYTADPRFVSTAVRIPEVSFREASELATFGAQVLHPRTIRPAVSAGIPVRVLSTLSPESEGTVIRHLSETNPRCAAVASKSTITLVNLYATEMLLTRGFLRRIFAVFESHDISIDLVSVSEVSVSVTLDNDDHLDAAMRELETFTAVTTKKMSMVSLVGDGLVRVPHIMRNIFSVLDDALIPVHMISLGASEINISFVVDSLHATAAVGLLHEHIIRQQTTAERNYL